MNYVEAGNDILINFQKIKYNSNAERDRRAALEYERSKRAQIEKRNAEKRRIEVTPALSESKNATSERMRVKAVPSARRKSAVNTETVSTARTTASEKSVSKVKTGTKALARTAAEILTYSCEEKAYNGTKYVKAKSRFPVAFFINAIVISILFVMLIGSYSQLSEATIEKGDLESKISACISEKTKLEQRVGEKRDLAEIENIAVNKLGMIPADNTNRGYISISGSDKIVISEDTDESSKNVSVIMSGVSEIINNFIKK